MNHVGGIKSEWLRTQTFALAGVAQWIECWPENRKVAGLIPSWGACLHCRPGPWLGAGERRLIDVSLAH